MPSRRDLRALVVGIDAYPGNPLTGCVADARRIAAVLEQHGTGDPNFDVRLLTAPQQKVTESILQRAVEKLFATRCDAALFYFSGHGLVTGDGGFIVTQDARADDAGMLMDDLLNIANESTISDRFIILDCCHSGKFGNRNVGGSQVAQLSEGLSVLTSSRDLEESVEDAGEGVFTALVIDALEGGAADLQGNVTPGSIYAFVDKSLAAWDQRPIFKANVSRFFPLRQNDPPIEVEVLRQISNYFEDPNEEYPLDPSYEYTSENPDPDKVVILKGLQKLESVGLVKPVGEEHMYWAAMHSKSCQLTAVGRHYWHAANERKI